MINYGFAQDIEDDPKIFRELSSKITITSQGSFIFNNTHYCYNLFLSRFMLEKGSNDKIGFYSRSVPDDMKVFNIGVYNGTSRYML